MTSLKGESRIWLVDSLDEDWIPIRIGPPYGGEMNGN